MSLSRQEVYLARWLGRAGQCSRSRAMSQGVMPEALDALVGAGLATRSDDPDPIYRHVNVAMPGAEARPREDPKPIPPSVDQRIVDLLADGVPRSSSEIAAQLAGAVGFVAQREIYREVGVILPNLVSRGFLHRTLVGVDVGVGDPRYDEKYVSASSVRPVCQLCFRNRWGVAAIPPQTAGSTIELCSVCNRRTNDPSYLPAAEVEERMRA